MHERPLLFVPADKFFVLLCSFVGKNSGHNLKTCISQCLKTTPRNQRIRIFDGTNDSFDSCVNESFRTGLRLAVMRVRFERNIRRAAFRQMSGVIESDDFGVCDVLVNVSSFANDLAFC